MLLASFLDPMSNGLDIGDLLSIGGLLTVSAGIFFGVGHALMKQLDRRIDERLKTYTSLIQPTSNTGTGLPDITDSLAAIGEYFGIELSVKRRAETKH